MQRTSFPCKVLTLYIETWNHLFVKGVNLSSFAGYGGSFPAILPEMRRFRPRLSADLAGRGVVHGIAFRPSVWYNASKE